MSIAACAAERVFEHVMRAAGVAVVWAPSADAVPAGLRVLPLQGCSAARRRTRSGVPSTAECCGVRTSGPSSGIAMESDRVPCRLAAAEADTVGGTCAPRRDQRQPAAQGLCLSTVETSAADSRLPTGIPPHRSSAYGGDHGRPITRGLAAPLAQATSRTRTVPRCPTPESSRRGRAGAGAQGGVRWSTSTSGLFGGYGRGAGRGAITSYRIGWPGDRGRCGPVVIAGPT